jgi:hypothetical protein
MNVRNIKPGERVLYRGFSGWDVSTVKAVGDSGLSIALGPLLYADVLAVVPEGRDVSVLLAELRLQDALRDDALREIARVRRERIDNAVREAEDDGELERIHWPAIGR